MRKWQIALSNNYATTEKYVTVESDKEPTHFECNKIAEENGYKLWAVTELWWERETLWDILKKHAGHKVSIVCYGDWDNPVDVCLEDEDTGEVILDAELYDIKAKN